MDKPIRRISLLALIALLLAAPIALAAVPADYGLLDGARNGRYLRRGSSGPAVLALQHALDAAGYAAPTTSFFDAATLSAVLALQSDSGISADGVVGPETVAALDGALSNGGGGSPAPSGTGTIPDRPAGAISGSGFIAQTWLYPRLPDREDAVKAEILSGNIPDFERSFLPVTVSMTDAQLQPHSATFWVAPDYLAIGSDADFVRMPMDPLSAQEICDAFGCSLPTRKMVDAIWAASTVKLRPIPLKAGPRMMSNEYFIRHQRKIEAQRAGQPLGALTSGDKKDVVISNRLIAHPDRVAIYGWIYPNGHVIQPLSTVHENTYADYSHGIRLVLQTVNVDGQDMQIADVLGDPVLSKLLSDEGPMPSPRVP